MGLNFPNAPTVGQLFPSPAVAGVPVYRWDGTVWGPSAYPWGGAVRYDISQALNAAQKNQAQANISLVPTVQKFTSGSGNYNPPVGCLWIRVKMVGGGGGGAGGGSPTTTGSNGTPTTFGPHTANGGGAGIGNGGGGTGGGGTIGAGGFGRVLVGQGGGAQYAHTGLNQVCGGGMGGNSAWGGGGNGVNYGAVGGAGNVGGGGGGGGDNNVNPSANGAGAGAGGALDIIIPNPVGPYAWSIGVGGNGAAGNMSGGKGGDGQIVVEEYYAS